MKILCQRNPLWAATKLGSSQLTVGRFGCTTCSIAMAGDYFGEIKSPLELAHDVNLYTADGLIKWSSLANIYKKMRFAERGYGDVRPTILAALKDPNQAVLLQVNNGVHWVIGLRKALFGNDIVVADPWNGDKCGAIARYKNITGFALFARK